MKQILYWCLYLYIFICFYANKICSQNITLSARLMSLFGTQFDGDSTIGISITRLSKWKSWETKLLKNISRKYFAPKEVFSFYFWLKRDILFGLDIFRLKLVSFYSLRINYNLLPSHIFHLGINILYHNALGTHLR